MRLAHQVPGPREREEALAEIARNMTANPDRAERVARSIGDRHLRVMALAGIAEVLLDES